MDQIVYSVTQVAELCDVHPGTVRRWIRDGLLGTVSVGRRRYVPAVEIHRLAGTATAEPAA